jgi:hypothetical protein
MRMMEDLLVHLARIEKLRDRLSNEEQYLYSTEVSARALRQCKLELSVLFQSLPHAEKDMLGEYTSHTLKFLDKLETGSAH